MIGHPRPRLEAPGRCWPWPKRSAHLRPRAVIWFPPAGWRTATNADRSAASPRPAGRSARCGRPADDVMERPFGAGIDRLHAREADADSAVETGIQERGRRDHVSVRPAARALLIPEQWVMVAQAPGIMVDGVQGRFLVSGLDPATPGRLGPAPFHHLISNLVAEFEAGRHDRQPSPPSSAGQLFHSL
jgi:hypothetical protein